MYTEVESTKKESPLSTVRVVSLKKTIETIRNNAINDARMKLPLQLQNGELAAVFGYPDFVQYFKHALAHEIAQLLATYDQRIQTIYLFDESINPDAETEDHLPHIDLAIHLLLRVTSNSAALETFITSLDRYLTEDLKKMPLAAFAGYTSFLDVIPITESAIQERRGYAVLLSSIYARPLEVWSRN
jgi:hypothetical protein